MLPTILRRIKWGFHEQAKALNQFFRLSHSAILTEGITSEMMCKRLRFRIFSLLDYERERRSLDVEFVSVACF